MVLITSAYDKCIRLMRQFYEILLGSVNMSKGPTADIVKIFVKYNLLPSEVLCSSGESNKDTIKNNLDFVQT